MNKIVSGVLLAIMLLSMSSCGKKEEGAPGAAKAREGYIGLNKGFETNDASVIDKYVDPKAIGHTPMSPEPAVGVDKLKEYFAEFHKGFSDIHIDVKTTSFAGDTLFGLYHMTATNSGAMMGMPATGKKVDIWGVDVIRFNPDGKLAEHWDFGDNYTFMKQLGVIPDMSQPAPPPTDSTKMMMEKK